MTENSFAEQIAKNAQAGAQAEAPFGAAIGVSKAVAETAFKSEAAHETSELNLEVAKKRIEQAGAGTFVTEMAGKCIGSIGTNLEKFGKLHKERAEGRINTAQEQRARITSIQNEKIAKLQQQEEQRILQAQVEQFNPNYRVGKAESWFQNKIGNKIDTATSWWKNNVEKKYNEMRVVANESDAQKFTNRAEFFNKGATIAKKAAESMRALTEGQSDEAGNTLTRSLSERQEQTANRAFGKAETAENVTGSRADTAADALNRARQAEYFMPDAKATSDSIKAQGGDADFSRTAEAAKEWSGRAAGTNATS